METKDLFVIICLLLVALIVPIVGLIISKKIKRKYENEIKEIKKDNLWDALICDCDKCEFVKEIDMYDEWKYGEYSVLVWKPNTLNNKSNKEYLATLHYKNDCVLSYFNRTKSEILAENLNYIKAGLAR